MTPVPDLRIRRAESYGPNRGKGSSMTGRRFQSLVVGRNGLPDARSGQLSLAIWTAPLAGKQVVQSRAVAAQSGGSGGAGTWRMAKG
jgi:hypothetical protein